MVYLSSFFIIVYSIEEEKAIRLFYLSDLKDHKQKKVYITYIVLKIM